MAIYKDVLLKTEFYKEQIAKELIKKGIYPDNKIIEDRVRNIDRFLALFKHQKVEQSEVFDTDLFKRELALILQDLKYLYQIAHEMAVKKYIETKAFVDSHLLELETISRQYLLRSQMEINSTFLGKTVFFKSSGFSMFTKNNETYIDLGTITVKEGSQIAWLLDAVNVRAEDALMGLKKDNIIEYIRAYNYMNDTFRIPGLPTATLYRFTMQEDQIINSAFEVAAEGLDPSLEKRYFIFGGHDQLFAKNSIDEFIIKKDSNNMFRSESPCLIEFYIHDGSYANFNFSEQPISSNFRGTVVEDLRRRHRFSIQAPANFGFNVITDGKVYAVQQEGNITQEKLYYPIPTLVKDFLIEEVSPGKATQYEAFVIMINSNPDLADIRSVAIKELNAMGV